VRWLSEEGKVTIRAVLDELHNRKRLSLLRISKEVGRSYTKIWGLCRALELPTRNVAEADRNSAAERSKHKRTPFDGTDEEKAYILGFANGDLTAWQASGTAVMVTSTTTHRAFATLFHELFEKYGPVYEYPMHEKGKGFKWKVAVRLDNSFQFLLKTPMETIRWAASNARLFVNWLAGMVDSDGNINITNSNGYARLTLAIDNQDRTLLSSAKHTLEGAGYHPGGPYRKRVKGTTTPHGIKYNKDMWRLQIERTSEAQNLLRELPIRHGEKITRKEMALLLHRAAKWDEWKSRILEMRQKIQNDVTKFLLQAERQYLSRHAAK
jgi:hypothetical protein